MKGIILHGGHGTRLRPLTHTGPKQLLPIANKPMSEYCVNALKNAGVSEIAIIIGGVASNKVKEYYGNGEKFDVDIEFMNASELDKLMQNISKKETIICDLNSVSYSLVNKIKSKAKLKEESIPSWERKQAIAKQQKLKENGNHFVYKHFLNAAAAKSFRDQQKRGKIR